ncbi:MAG TPA: hypothetical protein VLQ80_11745, partial [Candidatus Saccharimonadia bacterium]|nr:hypothetical protein [Candidatus Saccharimonadia bacterium]
HLGNFLARNEAGDLLHAALASQLRHVHGHRVPGRRFWGWAGSLGTGSHVGEQSVVMKHEVLLPHQYYVGAPTRPAPAPLLPQA